MAGYAILTLVVMVIVAYCLYRNGLLSAITIFLQVLISGLIAFNYWEPLADVLDGNFQNSKLQGYEDLIVLTGLFSISLAILRFVTNRLNPTMVNYNPMLQQIGAGFVGAITGYFVSGFICVVLQTLPAPADFLGFEPRSPQESPIRSYLPPDRVWISLMRFASANSMASEEINSTGETNYDRNRVFDAQGTFELRYSRHRRLILGRSSLPNYGDFDQELGRKK